MSSMVQTKKQVKSYRAADLEDVHTLARERLSWVGALVNVVRLNEEKNGKGNNKELLEIAEFLCETFAQDHDCAREVYEAEHNLTH